MRKRSQLLVGVAVAAALVGTACSELQSPTAVKSVAPSDSKLLGGLLGGVVGTLTSLLIPPVERTTPLANDVVWSFTAGPNGAVSTNADVGLVVVIPPGALSTTQTFTVTALAGSAVAYKFEPHVVFNRSVSLTQSLRGTSVSLLSLPVLSGAHFATDRLELTPSGLANVTEIVPSFVSPWTRTVSFGVGHFSGWIVASGRDGVDDAF